MTELRSFARKFGVVFSGTIAGQIVLVLAAPLLTRIYSPADLGAFGVYASLLGVLTAAVSLRFEMALPLPEDEAEVERLLVLCIGLVCVATSIVALAVAGIALGYPAAVERVGLGASVWLLAPGVLGAGAYQALSMFAVRRQQFRVLSMSRLSNGSITGIAQVVAGLVHAGPMSLGIGHIVGQISAAAWLAWQGLIARRKPFAAWTLTQLWTLASRYRRFPALLMPAHVLNAAGVHSVPVLLALIHGQGMVGLYFLGQRAVGTPAALVARSLGDVFMGQGAQLLRNDPVAFRKLFHQVYARLLILALPLVVALVFAAPPLFAWIFGEEWREAGTFVQLLAPVFLLEISLDPIVRFALLERQDLAVLWAGARFALICSALVLSWLLGLAPTETVMTLAVVMFASYLHKWFLWERAMQRCIALRAEPAGRVAV